MCVCAAVFVLRSRYTRARAMKSLTCLLATLALAVATEGPVGKVVNLLEDLKGKIEDDADMDEKDFKEHECWCKKVQASKAEMIEEGKKVVKVKESEIVEGKAKENTLQKEIEETKEEVGENQDSQAKGAKVRGTEHDENTQEIKEGKTLVNGINQVSKVFEKPALVQLDSKAAKAFQRYSPKAQTIQGILQNQLEQTESDVKQVTKEEEGATKTFKAWMTDMKEQLGILEDKKSDEEQEEVETEVEVAEDTETKVDTEEQIKADKAFLQEAETSCATRKAEYLNRTALRSIELGGISKAMEILDAKRELLSHLVAKPFGCRALLWGFVCFFWFDRFTADSFAFTQQFSTTRTKGLEGNSLCNARQDLQRSFVPAVDCDLKAAECPGNSQGKGPANSQCSISTSGFAGSECASRRCVHHGFGGN